MKLTREGQVFYPTEPCPGVEEKILLMQSGELADAEERSLMTHIESCEGCRALFQHYETIDDNIKIFMQAQQTEPPEKMQKKLRTSLSLFSKSEFVSRLQKLGQSIFYQNTGIADKFHPWSEPWPLSYSVNMLNHTCTALLGDPLAQEVGLAPEFVKDCMGFLESLADSPLRLTDLASTKEALDRALSIDPNHVMSTKMLSDYFYHEGDFSQSLDTEIRLLNLNLNSSQRWSSNLNFIIRSISNGEQSVAMKYFDEARSICDRHPVDFIKFAYESSLRRFDEAEEALIITDKKIRSDNADTDYLPLMYNYFERNEETLTERFKKYQTVLNIINEYSRKVMKQ